MKKYLTLILILLFVKIINAQDSTKISPTQSAIKKTDNYTIQRLIILNAQKQVLLEKGRNGWMTPSLRSNENQSLKEGLDSLANGIGISIKVIKLSGLYTYKYKDLADHKVVSYRSHYLAKYVSGELIQPSQAGREYKWFAVKSAVDSISNEALKAETNQILKYPKTLWGGSFLLVFKHDKLESAKMTEDFYPLSD
jgi:hypothetical protein